MTLSFISLIDCRFADSAFPAAVASDQRVFGRVFVPIFAVSWQDSWTDSYVRFSSERLKMLWINATSRLAKVMKIHSPWHRPPQQLKDESMSPEGSITKSQQPVTKFVKATSPEPAARVGLKMNLFLKARR